ncbi:NAD-dependent epimerase/dehydratase family protein [Nocardiopsis dassonvillei]|uniref:NAD-dependent epimerase/dehydratase family protein n=1 Tax=Nocardiopsis dassonvillei TaxID=2014 RepID=UPI0036FA6AB5
MSSDHPAAGTRVLVTGGAGFIGGHVVRLLASLGAEVTVLDSLDAYPFDQAGRFGVRGAAEVVRGDAADPATAFPLVAAADAVVHAAAVADVAACTAEPERDFSSMRAAQTVLEAARRHPPRRLVMTSSAQVYGTSPSRGALFHEDDAREEPGTLYANSKGWAEGQARLYGRLFGLPVTVLRYFSVYGPHQVPKPGSHSWAAALFSVRALRGLPLVVHGDGSQVRDQVAVRDVARATVAALFAPGAAGATVNVGSGRATSIAELADTVARIVPGTRIERGPRPPGDPEGGAADTGRMADLLGVEASTGLEEGLAEYVEWAGRNADLLPEGL